MVTSLSGNQDPLQTRRRLLGSVMTAGVAAMLLPGGIGRALAGEAPRTGARLAGGAPSSTALGAAVQRAVHQIVDDPRVLEDPFAVRIVVGSEGAPALQLAADRSSRGLRAYIAMRSRHAEDRLVEAVARGVRQYVLLGAGLDTFACRNPHADRGLRVFEVDHPATQAWKRERLAAAGITAPASLTFVSVDFETQRLADRLRESGFNFSEPAFFSMLGVVIYLTEEAMTETLRFVASCAPGSEVTFSFTVPASRLDAAALARRERSMAAMAALGEPWRTFLEPGEVPGRLRALGFGHVDVLTPERANQRYFQDRIDGLRVPGSSHMATALRV